MRSFKEKLADKYIKWRYSDETMPQFAKIGAKIGFGLMCIIAALYFIFQKIS